MEIGSQVRFSVATNFDDDLPALASRYGAREIFGKLPRDFVGGGRAGYMLAPASRRRLEDHVRKTKEAGLSFNYLLNSACLGNREFTRAGQRAIRGLLDWLSELRVDWVTVSIPYLLDLIKSRYPHLKVKVGVFAGVDTPTKARFFADLGADCITLQPLVCNRDFPRLKAIREAVTSDLQLIANHGCLLECPMTPYHNVGLSHASQERSGGIFVDYCLLRCLSMKLRDPVNYIKSPWIRPEDLRHYVEIGYSSFKILERGAPTATLLLRTRAYFDRWFDGNLMDLVQCYGFPDRPGPTQPKHPRFWELREFLKPWKLNPIRLLPLRDLAKLQGWIYEREQGTSLYVDNRALDGFIEKFLKEPCTNADCDGCRHCHDYAARALYLDPDCQARSLELADRLLADMSSGRMWGGGR